MDKLGHNGMRLADDHYGTRWLMFRFGSDAAHAMLRFRDCVENNRGRPLFEVRTCESPLSEP